jgi:hypothetical protein
MDYGHHAGSISRLAHDSISARLSTWHTHVRAPIDKYGRVSVSIEREGTDTKTLRLDTPECTEEEMKKDMAKRAKRR